MPAMPGSTAPIPRWDDALLPRRTAPRSSAPSASSTRVAQEAFLDSVQQEWGKDSTLYTDDSDELDPTKIMEEYIAQHNAINAIAKQLIASIKTTLETGPSDRRSAPRKYIQRDHEGAYQRLVADYFAKDPRTLPGENVCTRYRMRRHLFPRIVSALGEWSPIFTLWADCKSPRALTTTEVHSGNPHTSIWHSC
uniref:Uncharacterized protein n=1 Tax=Arundo donax TaxID=35708 RepID=A0A0A9AGY5_ARUDO